ncbi:MAG: hypothetical protein WC501_05160 [Candidatus Micrarchaeia archaeon]
MVQLRKKGRCNFSNQINPKDRERIKQLMKTKSPLLEQEFEARENKIWEMIKSEKFHYHLKSMIALLCSSKNPEKLPLNKKSAKKDSLFPIVSENSLIKLELACELIEMEAAVCRKLAEKINEGKITFATIPNETVFAYSPKDAEQIEIVRDRLFNIVDRVRKEIAVQRSFAPLAII